MATGWNPPTASGCGLRPSGPGRRPPVVGISPRWVDSIFGAASRRAGPIPAAPSARAPKPSRARSRRLIRIESFISASLMVDEPGVLRGPRLGVGEIGSRVASLQPVTHRVLKSYHPVTPDASELLSHISRAAFHSHPWDHVFPGRAAMKRASCSSAVASRCAHGSRIAFDWITRRATSSVLVARTEKSIDCIAQRT